MHLLLGRRKIKDVFLHIASSQDVYMPVNIERLIKQQKAK